MPKERLENILKLKLPISRIAREFDASRPLIYDAMKRYGINWSKYTNLEQDSLQQKVATIKTHHLNAGEIMVQGHLVAEGVHVQRDRIRKAIHDIDPSVTRRKRPPINRRVYYVPCPNYLWPIDGNHKWFDGAL